MQPQIEHVSDTALMVAACRAAESKRTDALIHDPFAERLAGERGMALASSSPTMPVMQFGIGMRVRFMDELLGSAIAKGVDTVLNLGAGLDARPWRLDLPRELRWIEVDFPEMIEYKRARLTDAVPRCRIEQASADLNRAAEREMVLDRAREGGGRTLLITEGLLMYLPATTLEALASDARAKEFRYWLLDVSSPELMRRAHGDLAEDINRVRAESHLAGRDILAVAAHEGWTVADSRRYVQYAPPLAYARISELTGPGGIDPKAPPPADDVSGVWLYQS